jgi:hypothetical protein
MIRWIRTLLAYIVSAHTARFLVSTLLFATRLWQRANRLDTVAPEPDQTAPSWTVWKACSAQADDHRPRRRGVGNHRPDCPGTPHQPPATHPRTRPPGPVARLTAPGPIDLAVAYAGTHLTYLSAVWAAKSDTTGLRIGLRVFALGSAVGALLATYYTALLIGVVPSLPEAAVSAWLIPSPPSCKSLAWSSPQRRDASNTFAGQSMPAR